jgi:hypothetical protein
MIDNKTDYMYNIGVWTVNIELMWRGLETGELIKLLSHNSVIITLHISLIKLISHTPVIVTLFTLA